MMINPCNPNARPPLYDQDLIPFSLDHATSSSQGSFLYNLSLLKDKILQIESVATIFLSPESTAIATPTMATLIQEIIATASSLMFSCQQMSHSDSHFSSNDPYGDGYDRKNYNITEGVCGNAPEKTEAYDIVELKAADLLAKYTHYCHVCGKGFKRDANLRMHMRAHGDEYKSSAALSKPPQLKSERKKYSCPEEGCRWNMRHAKFQPLKSMICVKNHYKRSHCPKMCVCNRCGIKEFSVLSDLRTHEKHCGDVKWVCSCGTNFSRKDKLMGHVALFVGHSPVARSGR